MCTFTSRCLITNVIRSKISLGNCFKLPSLFNSNNTHNRHVSIDVTTKQNPKIIIIGAGLAGLSAAEYLIQNGFDNVQLLEASNRYGGRIYTKHFSDAICELGAPYIIKNNSSKSLYECIKDNTEYVDLSKIDDKRFLTSKGQKLNAGIVQKASVAFNQLLKNSSFLKNTILIDSFNNSKVFLEKETEKLAKTLFKKDSHEASQIFNTLINDYCSFFGCDLSKIHVYQLSKTTPIYNNRLEIKNGMNTILKTLFNKIGPNRIIYSKPVNRIEWSKFEPDNRIKVKCLDNSEYFANHVLCTLPLGALKAFHSMLFTPALQLDKITAINNLGVSSPGQFYLKYKDNVKKWFTGTIKPAWSSIELINRTNIAKDIVEISTLPNSQHVLQFKRIGDEDFERINEVKIVKESTELLRKLLNNLDIPYPNDIIRSNWGTDTKYLGGLPVLTQAYSEQYVDQLALPCYTYKLNSYNDPIPKILFAGDATDWEGFGTLDGARQSGIREAQKLLDFYQHK